MPDFDYPYGSHAEPQQTRLGVIADDVQLGQGELADVDHDDSPPKAPYPKVAAAGAAGAVATLIVGGLALAGVAVPETVAAALATWLLSFAAGYLRAE